MNICQAFKPAAVKTFLTPAVRIMLYICSIPHFKTQNTLLCFEMPSAPQQRKALIIIIDKNYYLPAALFAPATSLPSVFTGVAVNVIVTPQDVRSAS